MSLLTELEIQFPVRFYNYFAPTALGGRIGAPVRVWYPVNNRKPNPAPWARHI
jgi:hypothetical protein